MIKDLNENLFNSPAQMRCILTSCKDFNRSAIETEARAKYPGMVEELSTRCKLWGSKNMGDVHFYLAPDGTVCANMFAETDAKLKACLKTVYEFAVRYGLTVGFPVGDALGKQNLKTVKALIQSIFKEEYAPTFYIVNHVGAGASTPPAAPQATPIPKPAPDKKTTGRSVVTIYTDGACKGNPGPGGWAAIMIVGNHAKELSGGERETTNNRMELLGAINALSSLKYPCSVTLHSNSKYLTDAFNKGWLKGWQKNNWKTASKSPVKNVELWKQMIELTKVHNVTFVWVKGHDGNPYNNRCDELAVAEAEKFR